MLQEVVKKYYKQRKKKKKERKNLEINVNGKKNSGRSANELVTQNVEKFHQDLKY